MQIAPRLDRISADLRVVVGEDPAGRSDADLLTDLAALEGVGRLVDAARVRLAGELGSRSRRELGDEGLSRSQNFTSPTKLLSAVTGISARESGSRLALGGRLQGELLLGGATGPSPFPRVVEALTDGTLAVETAGVITMQCAALTERGLPADAVSGAEHTLVDETVKFGLTPDGTGKLAVRLRELLDPDGAEPRDEEHQRHRALTFTRPRIGPRFVREDEFIAQTVTADTRTQAQKNVDAVTELIARAAGAPDMPRLAGATTTVNVHVTLNDLEAGRGVAWIDGIDEPVPASSIQQLRCHAPFATTVFGDRGEVLHQGKSRRLFTPAQNRALAARDGGCVWPGCERPPSWCESHHVRAWGSDENPAGRTDIDNAALLCHFHHSQLHKSGWTLVMLDGAPHVVPPRWRDPEQTPIPTTRRRTTLDPPRRTAA